jgi:hypothetical protein
MALPQINTPTFELTLPSTNVPVRYRPFLVKEQKILLMALESKESSEMLRAIKQIITNCCLTEGVKIDALPMFDLEYFFLRLRAKSIGESIELNLNHYENTNRNMEECTHTTKFNLNLMEVEVEKDPEHQNKIVLDEDTKIGIVLKYPTIGLADKMQKASEGKNQMDTIVDVVCQCIDYIFDAENTYPASESSKQELVEFINNLGQEQFAKINNFFTTMPKLKHTIHWECEKCGTKDHITLEGMANFFG